MILLFDIGNTRIKWAQLHGDRLSEQAALSLDDLSQATLQATLQTKLTGTPVRAVIANVSGEEKLKLLVMLLRQEWGISAEIVESTTSLAGVRNGYENPAQLGVDRWLALVAAYNIARQTVCIASVGTALTLDAVDEAGGHLGGAIIPGPDLMIESLRTNTAEIAKRSTETKLDVDLLAHDTRTAVSEGVAHAAAATIERFVAHVASRTHNQPLLFITGGACGRILPKLRVTSREVPDLVLRGLSFAVRHRRAS